MRREEVNGPVLDGLEKCVCQMYGRPVATTVNHVRLQIVKKQFTPGDDQLLSYCRVMELSQLPPYKIALIDHIKRANYQIIEWRNTSEAYQNLPNLENNGWKRTEGDKLEINWSNGDSFLNELLDILAEENYVERGRRGCV